MLAKKTSKNQLTLPREIVREFPDAEYFDVSVRDRKIILLPVRMAPADTAIEDTRDKMKKLGITGDDIQEAVRWAKRKKRR